MADLIRDRTPVAFSAHRDISAVTVKFLRLQCDDYLGAGDHRRVAELARLSASDVAGRIAAELNKRNRENKYLRQTVSAELWRNPHTRRKLQRMVRDHPQRRLALASFRMAAHDERRVRAFQLAKLLIEQVELAAQPLRPDEVGRLIDYERRRAENYRRAGVGLLAWLCERKAAKHARATGCSAHNENTHHRRRERCRRAAQDKLRGHHQQRGREQLDG